MKVVRLSALRTGRLYPTGNIPNTHSVRDWVNPRVIVRPEGLCQWKIPVTPSGIEPATFWLVVQCHNQLRYQQRAPTCTRPVFYFKVLFVTSRYYFSVRVDDHLSWLWQYVERVDRNWQPVLLHKVKKCRPNIYACTYVCLFVCLFVYIYWIRYTRTTRKVSLDKLVCLLNVYYAPRSSKIAKWCSNIVKQNFLHVSRIKLIRNT
jgi:hypothetical protein